MIRHCIEQHLRLALANEQGRVSEAIADFHPQLTIARSFVMHGALNPTAEVTFLTSRLELEMELELELPLRSHPAELLYSYILTWT